MASVVLYDIPSKGPKKECWSLNPWKPRMILNYKGIGYTTEWVEYPDLAGTLSSLGFQPNNPNEPGFLAEYTSPAMTFEDGALMMDSWEIAQKIEQLYPTPSLGLDEPIVVQIRDLIPQLLGTLRGQILPKTPRNVLSEKSAEYFYRTREQRFGMPLDQFEKEKGGDEAWVNAKGAIKEVGDLLRKHEGPFFLGERVTYADFILVSSLEFFRRVDPPSFEKFLSFDPAFGKVYEASKEWLKRAD